MKGIKNLIFDFGGVLIDLDKARCVEHFTQLGLHDLEQTVDLCHTKGFFFQHETGQISNSEFRDCIRREVGKPSLSDEAIDTAWNSLLGKIPACKLDCLLHLRKDYMVYLLSNTNDIHWQWAVKHAFPYKSFRVENYFEKIFLSYEMHVAKPDPAIFQQVIEETGIHPEETLFIDDSMLNCQTARDLGIRTYTPQPHEDWRPLFA